MARLASPRLAALTILIACISATAQLKILPGSAQRGEQVLQTKGCLNCHALNGTGRSGAPDLSRTPPHASTPGMLASTIWNHAPQMWGNAEPNRSSNSRLTSMEAGDLFAYLYSVLYFSPAGDVKRGQNVFETRCASCHTGTGGRGAALSKWKSVTDPVVWAERMWNHSAEMNTTVKLSNQDVADLLIYLRSVPELRSKSSSFTSGEPEQGLPVFERNCESCHSFGPATGNKIDLLASKTPETVTGYIAEMWNHASSMRGRGGERPSKLQPGDMSNLIAFLFSQSYFFERGNTARGRQVFETKNCATCHEARRKETGAPDLTQTFEAYSPITLTAAAWNHGPAMFRSMKQKGMAWPTFKNSEMADLIAYLNSRLAARVAR